MKSSTSLWDRGRKRGVDLKARPIQEAKGITGEGTSLDDEAIALTALIKLTDARVRGK
jgi:hypothetical protein